MLTKSFPWYKTNKVYIVKFIQITVSDTEDMFKKNISCFG